MECSHRIPDASDDSSRRRLPAAHACTRDMRRLICCYSSAPRAATHTPENDGRGGQPEGRPEGNRLGLNGVIRTFACRLLARLNARQPRSQRPALGSSGQAWPAKRFRDSCLIMRGSQESDGAHSVLIPPSTMSSLPTVKATSSEARKTTALASSSGRPRRPAGICETKAAISVSPMPSLA